jgi:TatA/E family protein of Tat protein translocase
MPNIGAPELIIILVIALLILGPGKLPEVGASLGKTIREFRKASTDVQEAVKVNVDTTPLPNVLDAQAAPNVTAPAEPASPVPAASETFSQAEVDQRVAAAVAAAKAETASTATPPATDPTSTAN